MALFQHIILCLNLKHKIIPNISTKVPKKESLSSVKKEPILASRAEEPKINRRT